MDSLIAWFDKKSDFSKVILIFIVNFVSSIIFSFTFGKFSFNLKSIPALLGFLYFALVSRFYASLYSSLKNKLTKEIDEVKRFADEGYCAAYTNKEITMAYIETLVSDIKANKVRTLNEWLQRTSRS